MVETNILLVSLRLWFGKKINYKKINAFYITVGTTASSCVS